MVRLTRATLFPLALMHVGAGDPGLPWPANAGGHRRLSTGISASARVPSGAPTGSREARELRDGDQGRYRGRGVLAAVGSVNSELADLILGRSWQSLAEADQAMIDLDGTADKSRLGANATVGSQWLWPAAWPTRLGSRCGGGWRRGTSHLRCRCRISMWSMAGGTSRTPGLPGIYDRPGRGTVDFRGAPGRSRKFTRSCAASCPGMACLPAWVTKAASPPRSAGPRRYCGFWCRRSRVPATAPARIASASPWTPAASEFRQPDGRHQVDGELLGSRQLIERLAEITRHFPVHLIEDGLGEDDDDGWVELTKVLGGTAELVGDDIFCTNPAIIRRGIARGIGNAALIKLNQIGTVTETLQAMAACREAGYRQFVSHPSGEPVGLVHRRPGRGHWLQPSQGRRPGAESVSPNTTGCWRSPPAIPDSSTGCPDGHRSGSGRRTGASPVDAPLNRALGRGGRLQLR